MRGIFFSQSKKKKKNMTLKSERFQKGFPNNRKNEVDKTKNNESFDGPFLVHCLFIIIVFLFVIQFSILDLFLIFIYSYLFLIQFLLLISFLVIFLFLIYQFSFDLRHIIFDFSPSFMKNEIILFLVWCNFNPKWFFLEQRKMTEK